MISGLYVHARLVKFEPHSDLVDTALYLAFKDEVLKPSVVKHDDMFES